MRFPWNLRRLGCVGGLLLLTLLPAPAGRGQEERPEFELELEIDRKRAKLGESVRLTVHLKKRRGKATEVNDLRLARNSVSLEVGIGERTHTVTRIYGEETPDPSGMGFTVVDRPPTRVRLARDKPLEMTVESICLLPGENRYRAVYKGRSRSDAELRSEVATVTVEAPEEKEGIAAFIDTSKGRIVVDLEPERAYNTVWNFLTLAVTGRFDGLIFHRILAGYIVQGGDPQGDGTGGPGWTIPAENDSGIALERGVVSMCLKRALDTAGSQFFIVLERAEKLDGDYTVFGRVVEGMRVVDRIAGARTVEAPGSDEKSRPIEPPRIRSVRPTVR